MNSDYVNRFQRDDSYDFGASVRQDGSDIGDAPFKCITLLNKRKKINNKMENTIIVLPPNILNAETKKLAEEKGYLIIETSEPEKIKVITSSDITSPNDILMSAIHALSEGISSSDKFIKELNRRLKIKESENKTALVRS